MRITNSMMTARLLTNTNRNMTRLDKCYNQMATGKKIQMPSEDPIIASRALKFRTIVSDTEQYSENVKQATSWMEITESAFGNINSILNSMRELCVYGSTDSLEISDREKVLTEYNDLVAQLEDELNVTYMGRYVFSGYKTDTPYIVKDKNGNNIINTDILGTDGKSKVDGQEISIIVGSDSHIVINSLGPNIYDNADYDLLHGLDSLYNDIQNGVTVNDATLRTNINKMIGNIDKYTSKVAKCHTTVGVRMNRLELIGNRLTDDDTNYTRLLANNEDVNYADVSMNLNLTNATYQAALKVGMSITTLTLSDFL